MSSDDTMPSVSKSSRFSAKSQAIIDAQEREIAKLKKLLVQAGIDPDRVQVPAGSSVSQVSETDAPRAADRAVQVQVKVIVQVQVQYARHARYSLYVQAAKATKVVEVMDATEQPRAVVSVVSNKVSVKVSKGGEVAVLLQAQTLPQISDVVRAPVAVKVTKDAEVVKVVKRVEVAKLPRALPRSLLVAVVAYVIVSTKSIFKFKYKFKIKFKQKK